MVSAIVTCTIQNPLSLLRPSDRGLCFSPCIFQGDMGFDSCSAIEAREVDVTGVGKALMPSAIAMRCDCPLTHLRFP